MRPSPPLVSVLICSYNAQAFVEATVDSVLRQSYRNMEVLVLDNGSSDKTVEVLERLQANEPRLRLYAGKENRGAYGGLNFLLSRAVGDYIAINDHDDIWHSDKIRRQVEFLESNRHFVGCGTAILNHYEKHGLFLLRRRPDVSTVAWHTSLVFRNVEKRYDVTVKIANDFHFMKNRLCAGQRLIHNFGDPLVLRRIRSNKTNLSSQWINLGNLRDILFVRIPIADKLPLLLRLMFSNTLFDLLVLKLLLRRHVIPEAAMHGDCLLKEYVGVVDRV